MHVQHVHYSFAIDADELAAIAEAVAARVLPPLIERMLQMSGSLADLQAAEVAAKEAMEGAIVRIQDLVSQITANATDPAAIIALTADLRAETDRLNAAAAVPAAPPAEVVDPGTGTATVEGA